MFSKRNSKVSNSDTEGVKAARQAIAAGSCNWVVFCRGVSCSSSHGSYSLVVFCRSVSCSSSSHSSHRPVVFLHFDVALSSLTLLLLTCHCWKLLNSACCVKFYENVNLELKCLICFCLSREILRTKFISNAHVGFFCLSRVKFYAQNLNLTCPICFFFSCQISCKMLISISLSEFCLFVSCQILRTKSQASAIFLKLLNSVRRVKFYERVNLDLTCRTCSC